MENKGFWSTLGKRWATFLGVIFEPGTFLLLLALTFLYLYSGTDDGESTSVLMNVLLTIASIVLGGRITKKWVELSEGDVVAARGKSAVRSLMLQLRSIAALENRIRLFRSAETEIEKQPDVVKRNYEEAIRTCESLQEQTVSAIENWTDIVPEADIKSQIGVISDLKKAIDEREHDLESLTAELQDTKGKSQSDNEKLLERIQAKEAQISNLQKEIYDRKHDIGGLLSMGRGMSLFDQGGLVNPSAVSLQGAILNPYTNVSLGTNVGAFLASVPPDDNDKS